MTRVFMALLVAPLCLGIVRNARSDNTADVAPANFPLLQSLTCPELLLRGCCDNYCPKPQPYITCFCHRCGTDDYCRKPYPCIVRFCGGCPDCYTRKPYPDLCRPLASDYFTCAAGNAECAESGDCLSDSHETCAEFTTGPIEGTEVSSTCKSSGH